MSIPIDRRQFLVAGVGLLAAGAVAGCSSSSKPAGQPAAKGLDVLGNTFDFIAGINQRVAVALADNSGNPLQLKGPVTLAIGPLNGPLGPPETAAVHGDGLANPYLLVRHQFATPGTYTVRATYQGDHADLPIQVIDASATPIPFAGKRMISVASPTNAAPLGVNPVCTAQPPCPFHEVSLDVALAQHRPIALQFATPALCQSRFCGPVLDNLVTVHQPFADKVTFIHCEIFTDLSGQNSTPPVTAYHLEHEPMLLAAGTDGVVLDRLDNAVDRGEFTDVLTRLVSA
jgi:hypothetical protein